MREMTQMYLLATQERDKYRQQIEGVKKNIESMDRIIKDNVDRALKARDRQGVEMHMKCKEQVEKIQQLENCKKCYSNTITYLEGQIKTFKVELCKE